MAHITTEKRTTMSAMRSHTTPVATSTTPSASATKENTRQRATQQSTNGKGIEILDFHESWLEEVELYKDKLVTCKQLSHHNHQSSQLNNYNYHSPRRLSTQMRSSAGHSTVTTPAKSTKVQQQPHQQKSPPSPRRSSKITDASAAAVATAAPTAKSPPPRITPKLNSVPAPIVGVLQSEPYKKVQVRITFGHVWKLK